MHWTRGTCSTDVGHRAVARGATAGTSKISRPNDRDDATGVHVDACVAHVRGSSYQGVATLPGRNLTLQWPRAAGPLQSDADRGARRRGSGAPARAARGHARHDVLHRRHPLRHLLHLPAPEGVPYILHRVGCSAMHGTLHKVWCGDSFSGAAHAASGPACNSYVKGSLIMSLG